MDRVQKLPDAPYRVDTGPLQIGTDWPGYFMRGDDAIPLAGLIAAFLEDDDDPMLVICRVQRLVDLAIRFASAHSDAGQAAHLAERARQAGNTHIRRRKAEGKL